ELEGCDNRHFGSRELERKRVLFEQCLRAPALGPVELRDARRVGFDTHLVDAVLITVEREHTTVALKPDRLDRRDHEVRREVRIRMGAASGHGPTVSGVDPSLKLAAASLATMAAWHRFS